MTKYWEERIKVENQSSAYQKMHRLIKELDLINHVNPKLFERDYEKYKIGGKIDFWTTVEGILAWCANEGKRIVRGSSLTNSFIRQVSYQKRKELQRQTEKHDTKPWNLHHESQPLYDRTT